MDTFDVLMVLNFFDVLFGFQCCDFRSSDLSPPNPVMPEKTKYWETEKYIWTVITFITQRSRIV
jgi:hypothetical protein